MKAASREEWGQWAERDLHRVANRWLDSVDRVRDHSAQLENSFKQIRYEDLFIKGGSIVNELYTWLGLPPRQGLSSDLSSQYPISSMTRIGNDLTDPRNERREQFFRRGDPQAWREELSASETGTIEAICATHMLKLGYRPELFNSPSNATDSSYKGCIPDSGHETLDCDAPRAQGALQQIEQTQSTEDPAKV